MFSISAMPAYRSFEVKVIETDSASTDFKLISTEFGSPKKKGDKEKLIAEFENRVIVKLGDSL